MAFARSRITRAHVITLTARVAATSPCTVVSSEEGDGVHDEAGTGVAYCGNSA